MCHASIDLIKEWLYSIVISTPENTLVAGYRNAATVPLPGIAGDGNKTTASRSGYQFLGSKSKVRVSMERSFASTRVADLLLTSRTRISQAELEKLQLSRMNIWQSVSAEKEGGREFPV